MEENTQLSGFEGLLDNNAEQVQTGAEQGFENLYKQQQQYFSEQKRALNTTTLLTTLATLDPAKGPESLQFTEQAIADTKASLELGNERIIRNQLVTENMKRQLGSLGKYTEEASFAPDPRLAAGFEQAYNNVLTWDAERKARTAIEEAAVDRIRSMAMSDPTQARVLLDQLEFGNAEETIRQFNVKLAVLRQRAEELDDEYQQSGWGRFLLNAVLNLFPTNYNFQRTGIVGTADFFDLFRVGSRQNDESQQLWNMPLDEFAEYAAKDGPLMQSIRDNATSIFDMVDDPGAAVEILNDLIVQGESTKFWNNVWGNVEIASAVPWTKLGSASRILVGAGDVRGAVRNMGNALEEMEQAGTETAFRRTGVSESEIQEELSVAAVRGGSPHVPLSEPVATEREAAQRLAEELFNAPDFGAFRSMEELQAYVTGRIDEIKRVIGSPIKDVHIVPTTLPGGQSVRKLVFTVGRKDGFGYASEAAANRGLKETGFAGDVFEEGIVGTRPVRPKSTVTRVGESEDGGSKAYVYHIATPEGHEAKVTLFVGTTGRGTMSVEGMAVNELGPKEIRAIAGQLADEIPELKTIEGIRSTGARAKALEGKSMSEIGESLLNLQDIAAVDATKLRGRTETFRDMSGQWFAKIEVDMPEAGWLTGELKPDQQGFLGRVLGRWFSSAARTTDPYLHGKALEAGAYLNRAGKHIDNEVMGVFRNLPGKSQKVVRALATRSTIDEKWYNEEAVHALVERAFGRRATDTELAAYKDLKKFNDMDWELRNTAVYLDKLSRNYSSVSFSARWGEDFDEIDGIVNYAMDTIPMERVYDVSRAKHYVHGRNPLDTKTLTTMKNNGYVMIHVPDGFKLPEGIVVNKLLIKKTDLKISPLKRNHLAYTEGGHRMYTSRYFVKQGRMGVQSDTGSKYLLAPNTFRTAENIADGNKWADVMNAARERVKNNRATTAQELDDEVFLNQKQFPTGQEFLDRVTDEVYDLDAPFETVFDRELPSMYAKSGEDVAKLFNEDELGINGYYRTTGRMYTSAKGEILRDTKGEVADILDPLDTLSKSLSQVSRQIGLHQYKLNAMERFKNTYKGFMTTDPADTTPANFLLHARVNPEVSLAMKNQIESQRDAILNVLRFESEADRIGRQTYQSLAEGLLGDGDSWMRKAAHDAVWWWKDNNPISALRGIAFDMKLGMFNPGQLLVQASTMVSATALSPKYGFKGMMGLYPLHAYILKRGSESMLDTLAKRGLWKTMGFGSADEFKEFARHAYRHGFMEMNGSHIMINNYGPNSHFGSFGEKQLRAREQARVFFYTSEVWNRLVAYRIAWGETWDKGLRPSHPEFNANILKTADDYSFNMTREAGAFWQKGLLSLPTQFWAYNARMIEAMFGKRFTPAQRARLIGVNFLMAGTAGVPGLAAVSEFVKEKHGHSPDLNSLWGVADRGIIDYLNYNATGADVLIGERVATGSWVSDTVKAIFGSAKYGEKSFADLVGGATYTISKTTSQTLWNLAKYAVAESGATDAGEITKENLINVLKEVSTFGNVTKAMMISQYGIYKSNKGTVLAADLPDSDSIYSALSFRPAKANEISYLMANQEDRDAAIKEVASQLRNWRQEAINTDDYEKYWRKANILIRMVPEQDRREVLLRTRALDDDSFYSHIEQKVSDEQSEEEVMESLH